MLTTEPTNEMIEQWKQIFLQNKDKLKPNKKTSHEVFDYLKKKYSLTEILDPKIKEVICLNITENEFNDYKYSKKDTLQAQGFYVDNDGKAKILYDNQDKMFEGNKIVVGLEFVTDYYLVEGSSLLYNEMLAFQGLDSQELQNFFCVAQYVMAVDKFSENKDI